MRLAIDISEARQFFPNIYNEDWLFVLLSARDTTVGRYKAVVQDRYDPFDSVVNVPTLSASDKGNTIADFGFFLKRRNPYNRNKKLVMVGGCHTYGVFGAIKAFAYWGEGKDNVAYDNCKLVVERLGHDPDFCALFEVEAIEGSLVVTPSLKEERLLAIADA